MQESNPSIPLAHYYRVEAMDKITITIWSHPSAWPHVALELYDGEGNHFETIEHSTLELGRMVALSLSRRTQRIVAFVDGVKRLEWERPFPTQLVIETEAYSSN